MIAKQQHKSECLKLEKEVQAQIPVGLKGGGLPPCYPTFQPSNLPERPSN
jgi:hypothetical protein